MNFNLASYTEKYWTMTKSYEGGLGPLGDHNRKIIGISKLIQLTLSISNTLYLEPLSISNLSLGPFV